MLEPADSFPTTNVTGERCFTAWMSEVFAEERKDRRDTRGNGILGA